MILSLAPQKMILSLAPQKMILTLRYSISYIVVPETSFTEVRLLWRAGVAFRIHLTYLVPSFPYFCYIPFSLIIHTRYLPSLMSDFPYITNLRL